MEAQPSSSSRKRPFSDNDGDGFNKKPPVNVVVGVSNANLWPFGFCRRSKSQGTMQQLRHYAGETKLGKEDQ